MTEGVKNICLTITSLAPGGAEKQCLLLASLLQEWYNVYLVIIDDQPTYQGHLDFISIKDLNHIFLEGHSLKKITTLRDFLVQNNIDLIFSYLPRDIIFSAIAGRGIVKKHIGGIRNALMEKSKIRFLRFFHNHLLSASISNCASGKDFFSSKGLQADKIHVIPNGIKIDTIPFRRLESESITITTMGRLVAQKDFPTAISSLDYLRTILPDNGPRLKLQIVGYGPLEEDLRQQIALAGLADNVKVITDAQDLSTVLKNSDIYLCTSIFEGVSNAILEAMAQSLPVIATDAGDNKLLVNHGINGYICGIRDHIGIGNALKLLIVDYKKRIDFGEKSYEILKKNHDLTVFRDRYLHFISEIE
ncbi:MAG: glycosyltransferase [Saprospiraceae bacterium]|nr:glycosyltransferase [Saprospiraceae bacterium]